MLVEMIGLIIFAIVTYILASSDPTADFVPLLAAIALGAVRLLLFYKAPILDGLTLTHIDLL